jgi:5-methylcytosine-specific restriction endonuclease McrA
MSHISFRTVREFNSKSEQNAKRNFTFNQLEAIKIHGYMCHYCRSTMNIVLDHKVPKCDGGNNDVDNLLPCCSGCNSSKRNKSYDEFIEWREAELIALETFVSMRDHA